MSDKIGPVTFTRGEEHPFLGRKLATEKTFSEQMAWLIDQEIEKLIRQGEEAAGRVIEEHRQGLERLATVLLEEEVLGRERVITSYSIHYTKLYERRGDARRRELLLRRRLGVQGAREGA